ncbi:hypothetical protein BC830DRAFT_1221832 [Chytriomyces sp. MP71]|nr:hypothetical protein BC830DRAFT_1221832 [Chytriomyces sp. MP71]
MGVHPNICYYLKFDSDGDRHLLTVTNWQMSSLSSSLRHACERCRAKRRRCDMRKPGCVRCERINVACVYASTGVAEALCGDRQQPLDVLVRARLPHPQSTLDMLSNEAEHAMVARVMGAGGSMAVEDPDLAATYTDYLLVNSFFLAADVWHTSDSAALYLIDRERFMASFFSQPPALRLVLCTLAAYTTKDEALPKHLYVTYYARAKKALARVIHTPSLKTLQAIYLTAHFVTVHGQSALAETLCMTAISMANALNLGTDPSHNPAVTSKSEQEEYRRCYWRIYCNWKCDRGINDNYRHTVLQRNDVQLPTGGVRGESPLMTHICDVWDLIYQMRVAYDEPPAFWSDLLVSSQLATLNANLIETHSRIPSIYILVPDISITEDCEERVFAQYDAFTQQMLLISPEDTTAMLQLTLNLEASLCILMRPKLYLTTFLTPETCSPQNAFLITTAVTQTNAAATRIAELARFMLYLIDKQTSLTPQDQPSSFLDPDSRRRPTILSRSFWLQQMVLSYAFFESAVCLWVLACRTRPGWNGLFEEDEVVSRVRAKVYLLEILRHFEVLSAHFGKEGVVGRKPNMVTPLILSIEAMVRELEELIESGESHVVSFSADGNSARMERIVLEMKAMGISDVEEVVSGATECPLAYLGLLGLEVNGVLRWKGEREDKWRTWWTEQYIQDSTNGKGKGKSHGVLQSTGSLDGLEGVSFNRLKEDEKRRELTLHCKVDRIGRINDVDAMVVPVERNACRLLVISRAHSHGRLTVGSLIMCCLFCSSPLSFLDAVARSRSWYGPAGGSQEIAEGLTPIRIRRSLPPPPLIHISSY